MAGVPSWRADGLADMHLLVLMSLDACWCICMNASNYGRSADFACVSKADRSSVTNLQCKKALR